MAKVCLAYLIVFNQRREGEVSNILLKTYDERPNYSELENHELRETMSPAEQVLCQKYSYLSTRGKQGRMVPLVFRTDIKEALDILVKYRSDCGISANNIYSFANSSVGYFGGSAV